MNVQAVEQPEEHSQAELQEHAQAYIRYRLRFVDFKYLGQKAEHCQNGCARAYQFPLHPTHGGCDGILAY
jgi:hypothetical protein